MPSGISLAQPRSTRTSIGMPSGVLPSWCGSMRPRARWIAASTPTASASFTRGSHKPMGRIFRVAGSPTAAGGRAP
eukprot:5969861-Pyramimonas_sp.AAC.1